MSAATGYTVRNPARQNVKSQTGEVPQNERRSSSFGVTTSVREKEKEPPGMLRWTTPKVLVAIFSVAAVLILTLMSYAEMVVVNDQLVALRTELGDLQSEARELDAEYELAYDLSTIETELISSGRMTKVQDWQTYTLELARPDSVEYYKSHDIFPRVLDVVKEFSTAVKEYF